MKTFSRLKTQYNFTFLDINEKNDQIELFVSKMMEIRDNYPKLELKLYKFKYSLLDSSEDSSTDYNDMLLE